MRVLPVSLALGLLLTAACGGDPAPASTATTSPAPQTPVVQQPAAAPALPATQTAQDPGPAKAWIGPLPPLTFADYPAGRPPETIKAVYEYAARHPEVLHYVPCFCGCESSGHRGNDDCFVSAREANGRPIWEPHGAT